MPGSAPKNLIAGNCVVGQRGTVTLPRIIMDALGITAGDTLRFEVGPDGVTVQGMRLVPVESPLAKLAEVRLKQIANGDYVEMSRVKSKQT